ncbi:MULTISPECIES: hypothetical protein [unclassified Pseudomonas]|uniref:hypothetical protein n=1 Tax=unclassified Pseudomonas TaxID=196821 RepID=UPI000839244B|nr:MULTISPECIES: hypothetical protein [unclassified Pseudomonas]QIH07800.1 hypothetical protein ATY02_14330 [Pseudomonas sp. BIOMIG1BAC]UMZ09323.1 hypothetical protein I9018_17380 [Pseudomonas sp. MPFS]
MHAGDLQRIYDLLAGLLRAIQDGEPSALAQYGISTAIYEEVLEELEAGAACLASLALPAWEMALAPDRSGRVDFDCYPTQQPGTLRVTCRLWSAGRSSELSLTADYCPGQAASPLQFRLLEVQ